MKKLSPIFAACLLGFCAVASATTYECTDRQGRRTYTASPGPNCRAINLGRMTPYPAPVRYGNERNYARYLERIGKLEEEVNKAQQEVNNLNK